jgi:CheY-like chemotaxis protein/anti-sigma regulatory factor (Ser/Thr protein kinase)
MLGEVLMPTVLVVDDSAMDRRLAGSLLQKGTGLEPVYAANGREALEVIERLQPTVVVTDLQMPELDGLELVGAIRSRYPALPVVLMTAHGSEEIAVKALQKGAASYVPKRSLARELVATVRNVLEVTQRGTQQERVLSCLTFTESRFELDNDLANIPPLIAHVEAGLSHARLCDETALIQIGVALREALVNAIVHGNLEVASELREGEGSAYLELAERRRGESPYRERRVRVTVLQTRSEARYVVLDEGPGFDPSGLPDPTDPAQLERAHGRGLLLIRTFMDEVRHNARGNEITMVKRCAPP